MLSRRLFPVLLFFGSSSDHCTGENRVSIKIESLTTEDIKFIINELRKASIIWSGRKEILQRARRRVMEGRTRDGKPKYKYHWQCAVCSKWFRDVTQLEVDHIVEIGGITEFTGDMNVLIGKIFPRPVEKHLQCLCISCHLKKTKRWQAASHKFTRKR